MTKVFPTRWCTGASMGPQKPLCHRNLWWILYFIIYTLTIFKKQIPPPQQNTVSKWRPMIYFVSHRFNFGKNMKKHFSKGVFQWVWFFIFTYLLVYLFFASREGYPWGWHLKIAPVKNFDTIVIKYRGLRKTVVGPVGTPSLVRLSHVLGVNIKFWYNHFDTLVLVS